MMHWLKRFCLATTVLATAAAAAEERPVSQTVIPTLAETPALDGVVTPAEWSGAVILDGFRVLDLNNAPDERTKIRIGRADGCLWLAVQCWMQPGIAPKTDVKERDGGVFGDDCVELYLDPGCKGNEYQLAFNSAGVQYDARNRDVSWNCDWKTAARPTEYGWEAECRIPLDAFGSDADAATWGLLIGRAVWRWHNNHEATQGHGRYSQWGGNCVSNWHQPEHFGLMILSDALPRISVTETACRSLKPALKLEVAAGREKAARVNIGIVLRKAPGNNAGEEKATVQVFNDESAAILAEDSLQYTLQPEEWSILPLPPVPADAGDYEYQITAATDGGEKFFEQNIPISVVTPVKTGIARFPSAGVLEVRVEYLSGTPAEKADHTQITLKDAAGKVFASNQVRIQDGKSFFRWDGYRDLPAGSYLLEGTAFNHAGEALLEFREEFTRNPPFPWEQEKPGAGRSIPPGWPHGVKVVNDRCVEVWGRSYRFNAVGMPLSIQTTGTELLAEAMELLLETSNGPVTFTASGEPRISGDDYSTVITYRSSGSLPGWGLTLTHTIDFDGFVYSEVTIDAPEKAAVDSLRWRIPLRTETAKYRLPVFNDPVSLGDQPYSGPAIIRTEWNANDTRTYGLYYVGAEEYGLAFSTEDVKGWNPLDFEKAMQVSRHGNRTMWEVDIIGKPTPVEKVLHYAFCWQATPAKPVTNRYSHRAVGDLWYPVPGLLTEEEMRKHFACGRELGVKQGHVHEPWTEIMGYPGTFTTAEAVKKANEIAGSCGIRMALYGHPIISSLAPEFTEWGNEFSVNYPAVPAFQRQPRQDLYFICHATPWSDFYIYRWREIAEKLGVGAMYLDGTFSPFSNCANPYHAHAYKLPDGRQGMVQPIRAARDFMIRFCRELKEYDPGFFLLGHGQAPFTGHFMDYAMTGENFWLAPAGFEVPLDYIRCQLSFQWGTPMEFYRGPILTSAYLTPLALVHGIGVWSSGIQAGSETEQFHTPVWRAWEQFGIEDAEFIPYWKHDPRIQTSHPDVVASVHLKPGTLLLAAATSKRVQPEATITLDLPALGIAPDASVRDAQGELVTAQKDETGRITLPFPGKFNSGYLKIGE